MPRRSATAEAQARSGRPRAQDIDRYIGARIRERRIAPGLTQQQLAALIGTTYQQAHTLQAAGPPIRALCKPFIKAARFARDFLVAVAELRHPPTARR
jgi:hypothetical protein